MNIEPANGYLSPEMMAGRDGSPHDTQCYEAIDRKFPFPLRKLCKREQSPAKKYRYVLGVSRVCWDSRSYCFL